MPHSTSFLAAIVACANLFAAQLHARPTHECGDYVLDVAYELESMRAPPQAFAAAGNTQQAAMPLALGQHYVVELLPQAQVAFIVPPGRAARDSAPQGGMVYFHADADGRHRIGIDTGHWIDVVDAGR